MGLFVSLISELERKRCGFNSLFSLLKADVATATVLISMGAVLGRTSYIQLLVMGVIEIAVFTGNSYLGDRVFKVGYLERLMGLFAGMVIIEFS